MDKQDLIKLVLMCALHSRDPALDAPWASQEGSTVSLGLLSCLAQALGSASTGMTLAKHQNPSTLCKHWLSCDLVHACDLHVDILAAQHHA